MTTKNAVGNSLTGSTGSGTFVGATSPTLVTPVLGAASATSLAFSSTSGIIGTTTNDNAAAGSVGEIISSTVASGSAVSLSDGVGAALTSISLTAGDWLVFANFNYIGAASTVLKYIVVGINSVANLPSSHYWGGDNYGSGKVPYAEIDSLGVCHPAPPMRISLSSTTTVYAWQQSSFAIDTLSVFGSMMGIRIR